ncbi:MULTISPECIES: hypothetical protein [Nocardia]|uniref:hypothetical protein n=1 Tax=Nocardia TaxID=1817 RepID=UPI001895D07E|nr:MULTISPECIES: hypothetical protein [Nocardia]MBF6348321.1 hypothetical protein [Nocardia flavorosea]
MNATKTRYGLLIAAATLALAGCTEIEQALNKGGDTPCREYIAQDPETKRVTITKFLEEQRGQAPTGTNVDLSMAAVDGLCTVQANADTPIERADLAGIFIRK